MNITINGNAVEYEERDGGRHERPGHRQQHGHALRAQHGRGGRSQGPVEQLPGRVRPDGRRRDHHDHQGRQPGVPRIGLRLLPSREPERQRLLQQPDRYQPRPRTATASPATRSAVRSTSPASSTPTKTSCSSSSRRNSAASRWTAASAGPTCRPSWSATGISPRASTDRHVDRDQGPHHRGRLSRQHDSLRPHQRQRAGRY